MLTEGIKVRMEGSNARKEDKEKEHVRKRKIDKKVRLKEYKEW